MAFISVVEKQTTTTLPQTESGEVTSRQSRWLDYLYSENLQQRKLAVHKLGKEGNETAIAYLSQILQTDSSRVVRSMCRRAIRQIKRRGRLG